MQLQINAQNYNLVSLVRQGRRNKLNEYERGCLAADVARSDGVAPNEKWISGEASLTRRGTGQEGEARSTLLDESCMEVIGSQWYHDFGGTRLQMNGIEYSTQTWKGASSCCSRAGLEV